MQIELVKNKIYWTEHAREKMRYYGLSESRVLRILRHPKRVEEGVAENTTAVMQSAGSVKHPYEIWMMYQKKVKSKKAKGKSKENIFLDNEQQVVIISAWKYPGVTKPGAEIPIPEEVRAELRIMN